MGIWATLSACGPENGIPAHLLPLRCEHVKQRIINTILTTNWDIPTTTNQFLISLIWRSISTEKSVSLAYYTIAKFTTVITFDDKGHSIKLMFIMIEWHLTGNWRMLSKPGKEHDSWVEHNRHVREVKSFLKEESSQWPLLAIRQHPQSLFCPRDFDFLGLSTLLFSHTPQGKMTNHITKK